MFGTRQITIDPRLQAKLARRGIPRHRPWHALVAGLVIVVLTGYTVVRPEMAGWGVPSYDGGEGLGKLTVLAAESSGADPVVVWEAMEGHVGKKARSFTMPDRIKAYQFLVNRIDFPQEDREAFLAAD